MDYQSEAAAISTSKPGFPLIGYNASSGQTYIGVDSVANYEGTTARGRPSIRIETEKKYQYGLFIADLAHMPANVCGTWPAL